MAVVALHRAIACLRYNQFLAGRSTTRAHVIRPLRRLKTHGTPRATAKLIFHRGKAFHTGRAGVNSFADFSDGGN